MPAPAVELSGLHKSFGSVSAVAGVDLTIPVGEVLALLGPNGAGKSTTIDLTLGLSRPTSGSVSVFGEAPRGAIVDGRVGAMLQGAALLPTMTVAQSVALIASVHRDPLSLEDALARAGVSDIGGQRVNKLSGGQLQRARFAVAIVSNPSLLILDEPTAAMDVEGRRDFWQSMREFTDHGRTVIFATHYLDEADTYADRIVILKTGRVVADGTPAEVKAVVSGRTIRFALDDSAASEALAAVRLMPGVRTAERRGLRFTVVSGDPDATLRRILVALPSARGIEVVSHTMDDAFLELTSDARELAVPTPTGA
ncbi:ABC transporter ATP-binding protein [Lacisediminihabitans sp.]|uniref:ABC transporter ATP-binding protein n=1 Tax=Lacisediminihabitans sp. TaxID=2787631 RepID=UPI00374DF331